MEAQTAAIGALGVLILAGIGAHILLRKSGFSDVLLLILLGAAAGLFLPQQALSSLSGIALPFASIALLMIILDEGLNLSFEHFKRSAHKAAAFGAVSFALSFACGFALCMLLPGSSPLFSLLVGAMFASVAPELLSGFLSALGASKETAALGRLEAVLSDALSVIISLMIAHAIISGQESLQPIPYQVAFIFLFSVAAGSVFAAAWRAFICKIEHENQHLLVIGLAACLYAVSAALGADSVISVFTFAFFLGNISHPSISEMRRFQSEISFFLRTFFFVYLGMLLFHSPKPLQVGLFALSLSILLALSRLVSGKLACLLEPSARQSGILERVCARGLTLATLSIVVFEELS
ncbi:MAG: cation:proton antiporter, partial [Candidatus Micrarchaeota archaeon]|nr:cation:proton antiporter [Candidatus Micrarchaeota archaeon]